METVKYFNNQISFHHCGILYNIYAVAISIYDRHTSENMHKLIYNFLDIVCVEWHNKLISVGTDNASSMMEALKGVNTRLENNVQHELYPVWCGLHQLDLVMKYAYKELLDSEFNGILHGSMNHLYYQQNLIMDI